MSRRSAATRQGFNQYMRSQEDSTFSSPAVRNPLAIDQHLSSTLPIPSNPFAIPSSPPPIPSNPFAIDQRPSSTFRPPNNPPAMDWPRPSHPAFDRADDDRWRQLNSDHRVLKEGFNKLHAKYRNSVGEVVTLQAQLQASRDECADLQRRMRDTENQVRMAREETEAARNEMPQNIIAEITDAVKCNVCLDLPIVPFSTDCRHVFCGVCLAATFHSNGNTCPECRTICGTEPKRDFALRGIIRLLYTLKGREEPTAASTGFDLGVFADMYRQERERQLAETERARLAAQIAEADPAVNVVAANAIGQVHDVEMVNGGIVDENVIEVRGSGAGESEVEL